MENVIIALTVVMVFGLILGLVKKIERTKSIILKVASIVTAISIFIGCFFVYKQITFLNLNFLKFDFKLFDFKLFDFKEFDIKELDLKNLFNSKFSIVSKIVLAILILVTCLFIISKIFVFATRLIKNYFSYKKEEGKASINTVSYDIDVIPNNTLFVNHKNIIKGLTDKVLGLSFVYKEAVAC